MEEKMGGGEGSVQDTRGDVMGGKIQINAEAVLPQQD